MAPEENCEKEVFVIISWENRTIGVLLSQLEPLAVNAKTKQAVEDWQYWSKNY